MKPIPIAEYDKEDKEVVRGSTEWPVHRLTVARCFWFLPGA
jgi:hypothetical protein